VPKTILVVDDEADMVRLLDYALTQAGYLVIRAKDGEDGLAAARKHQPDLVLLDIMMPGLDGLDVCRKLKGDPSTANALVVLLTAKSEEGDRVLGLELGADDYVTKPFAMKELLARVKALLRRADPPGASAEVLKAGPLLIRPPRQGALARGPHPGRAGRRVHDHGPHDRRPHRGAAAQARPLRRSGGDDPRRGLQAAGLSL
jgi:DNA-binding response OmpR family regulator